jgi:hypothetical protein
MKAVKNDVKITVTSSLGYVPFFMYVEILKLLPFSVIDEYYKKTTSAVHTGNKNETRNR